MSLSPDGGKASAWNVAAVPASTVGVDERSKYDQATFALLRAWDAMRM